MFPPAHMGGYPHNLGGRDLPFTFSTEPLVGYRVWRVVHEDDFQLGSLHKPYFWKRDNMARCVSEGFLTSVVGRELHDAPDIHCACGLYASLPERPIDEWERVVSGKLRASGTIAMSGRIIRCTAGFKAQFATIQPPVVLDVDCFEERDCENDVDVVHYDPQVRQWFGYCTPHVPEGGGFVDATELMGHAADVLSESLGVEVLSFRNL